jgi:hypothetical protein
MMKRPLYGFGGLGLLLSLLLLISGCAKLSFTPVEGIYDLKLKTLTFLDLIAKDVDFKTVAAELTESPPAGLDVDIDLTKLTKPTFGSLKLGNNDRKIWFVMGQGKEGFWTEVYLDQNADRRIDLNEKLKGVQTLTANERKFKRDSTYTMVPVSVKVSFKGIHRQIQKKLYYFFYTDVISYKATEPVTIVGVSAAGFLEGEIKVARNKRLKLMKVRIYDTNGNGCFNDFGTDMFYLDLNYDGLFNRKEGSKLLEFFDGGDPKQRKQLRLILPALPAKMAVIDSLQEFNRSKLEMAEDKAEEDETEEDEVEEDEMEEDTSSEK